jgi:hypothetical protein
VRTLKVRSCLLRLSQGAHSPFGPLKVQTFDSQLVMEFGFRRREKGGTCHRAATRLDLHQYQEETCHHFAVLIDFENLETV